jgi:protein phosphatase
MTAKDLTGVELELHAAAETDIGRRPHNEDAVLARPDLGLFLVADGAGGQNAGNVASALATTSIAHFYERTRAAAEEWPEFDTLGLHTGARRLAAAIQNANREIVEVAATSSQKRGMGTTIVALHLDLPRRVVHLGHVGDSRCHRFRHGFLEQLTQDHSLLYDVLELRPDIDDAEALKLPRAVITRALGMAAAVRVSVRSLEIAPGDIYVLTSDGVTDVLDDAAIVEVLEMNREPRETARILIERAKRDGADDNLAVAIVRCDLPPGALPLARLPVAMTRQTRRASQRAALRASEPPPPRDPDLSDPEIMIVGAPDDDTGPVVTMVPAPTEKPSRDVLDTVTTMFRTQGKTFPKPKP